jgi:microcin C transport system permease protein
MLGYIARRLLLMVPTLLGIMMLNFLIIQITPGGPIEQIIAQVNGEAADDRVSRGSGDSVGAGGNQTPTSSSSQSQGSYRGAQGLPKDFVEKLEKQFGFDKPLHERFFSMLWNYMRFDFGESYFRSDSVLSIVLEKMPVSISLGLWTTFLTYLVCIPLGISKAVRDGSRFDVISSAIVIVGQAIPSFSFAVLLVIVFGKGGIFEWFPVRGLFSSDWDTLSLFGKITDYFWHLALPLIAMMIGAFAGLTFLTKNSFLDQIRLQYVLTARAKGLSERRVLYGHVFRNAMLIVIAGFPAAFTAILFSGSLFIETIFSLDGLGLLGFESALKRDFPLMFGTLYIFSIIGLLLGLISDLTYMIVDPRIDFESRET